MIRFASLPAVWAAVGLQGAAAAEDLKAEPLWMLRPTESVVASHYPDAADLRHLPGQASTRCRVGSSGELNDCAVASETPAGAGFGRAAVYLMRWFRMRALAADGTPTLGRTVVTTIDFTPRGWARLVDAGPGGDGTAPRGAVPQVVRWVVDPAVYAGAYYPARAHARPVAARVVMHCRVKADGGLADCAVTSEAPPDLDFGKRALWATRTLRVERRALDGSPTEGRTVEVALVINPPCSELIGSDRVLNGCPPDLHMP